MKNLSLKSKFTILVVFVTMLMTSLVITANAAVVTNVTEASLADTHELLGWQPTAGSFWESTSGIMLSTQNTAFNNQYMASAVRFTKEDIPVGSYIFIDSGYRYRPEGWQNETDKNTNSRPDYVTSACVFVDEDWWDNYTLRAFHIQNTENDKTYTIEGDDTTYSWDLRANFDVAKDKLRIYVPKTEKIYYNEVDIDWTLGFWDSTNHSVIATGSDLANCFVASQMFTKETLPIGSIIEIDSGYKYRPDGWIDLDTKNSSSERPGNVTTSRVEVTEEWWGDYNYRGFNVSTSAQGDISNIYLDVASHFRILIPTKNPPVYFVWTIGFWDSTSHSVIATGSDLANCFVASQLFTKETLPVGSIIEIDSGYKYRPDGWIDLDTKNSSSERPGNVTTSRVEVTEEWWGDYNYRGFNVSTSAQGDISNIYLEIASHFNITLPDGTKILHSKNPNSGEDNEEEKITVTIPEAEDSVIRILAIGNSFSSDAMHYTHQIAESLGIKAEFYNLYYGGCTIQSHYNFYNNDSAEYVFYKNQSQYVSNNVTMKSVLEATQFDYITFQQGSWSSDSYSSYALLDDLMAIVREYQPNAEFMIHQTWGYCEERSCNGNETSSGKGYETSADMFAAVEACYERAAADNGNLRIIKSGRAVETAKTSYGYTDDYGNTNSIYSDFNSHLANAGDYLAGCVWIETIFGTDVRNATYVGSFADADILQEIAHATVNPVLSGTVILDADVDLGVPVIKIAAADGYDYDGRARIVILRGAEAVDKSGAKRS